jgi:1-acyl-sn-glycerol-3-phosphate acyltransferase
MASLSEDVLPTGDATALPTVSDAAIRRAREGLAAARDRQARADVAATLVENEQVAEGRPARRISGGLRHALLNVLVRTLFDVRIENVERIPKGPCILAPNHLNHIDPFLVLAGTPPAPYAYVLGDARTLFNKPWKRWLIRLVRCVVPLDRVWKEEVAVIDAANAGREDLKDLADGLVNDVPNGASFAALRQLDRIVQGLLARGNAMLIFPEGGLSTTEGKPRLPLKRGTVIYAMRAGVPIVPIGLIGTRDLFFRKQLTMRIGEPLMFEQNAHPRSREVEIAQTRLEEALQALLDPDYREPQGPKPFRHTLNHMFW